MDFLHSHPFIAVGIAMAIVVGGKIYLFTLLPEMPRGMPLAQPGPEAMLSSYFSKPVSLIFVGDIMLDRGVRAKVLGAGNGDYEFPFAKIASTTKMADLTIGNLEGALSDKGTNVGSIYSFRMDSGAVKGLTFAGFDVLTMANNHSSDWGRPALEDTIANIESAGILPIGAGLNRGQAYAPAIVNIRRTKLAFLGFSDFGGLTPTSITSGIAGTDATEMAHAIQNARRNADLVFVYFHFGEEYQTIPTERQQDLAHAAIDDGADMVVGSHPHVIEPMEEYKGKPIVYSLGNFIFDQNFSTSTMDGGLLKVTIHNKKIESVNLKQLHMDSDFQPELVPGA